MEKEIKLVITLLNEVLRINSDIHKTHDYPDLGEPFDENASRLQAFILLELASLYINKAQKNYPLSLLKNEINRKIKELEKEENE